MGLDMFLKAEVWLHNVEDTTKEEIAQKVRADINANDNISGKIPPDFLPETVEFQVMYWRKANAIHKWFVDNVQGGEDDCEEYRVSKEQILELKETCENILEMSLKKKDGEWVHELDEETEEYVLNELPTTTGTFFGSDDYNDYYFADLVETVLMIRKIQGTRFMHRLKYRSSW